MMSRLCQMWLPEVRTSTPASRSSSAARGLIPLPCDAFSPLATTKSISASRRSPGSMDARARRPGRPTTSPRNSRRISVRDLARPRLPDHRDLDLARIGHLLLDPSRHVARQHGRLVVRNRPGIDDDANLAARLHRVRPLDAAEGVADALEVFQALGVALEHLAPRPRPGTRQGVR